MTLKNLQSQMQPLNCNQGFLTPQYNPNPNLNNKNQNIMPFLRLNQKHNSLQLFQNQQNASQMFLNQEGQGQESPRSISLQQQHPSQSLFFRQNSRQPSSTVKILPNNNPHNQEDPAYFGLQDSVPYQNPNPVPSYQPLPQLSSLSSQQQQQIIQQLFQMNPQLSNLPPQQQQQQLQMSMLSQYGPQFLGLASSNEAGVVAAAPQQKLDKDKIEKSIRKMRAYQKFIKVFNSTTHKKDGSSDSRDPTLRKKSQDNLKLTLVKKESLKSNKLRRKQYQEQRKKMNSQVVDNQGFGSHINAANQPNIEVHSDHGQSLQPSSRQFGFSRKSSMHDINSSRSLNNTQAGMLQESMVTTNQFSEFEQTKDFLRSSMNVKPLLADTMVYREDETDLDRMDEFKVQAGFTRSFGVSPLDLEKYQDLKSNSPYGFEKSARFQLEGNAAQDSQPLDETFQDFTETLGDLNLKMIQQTKVQNRFLRVMEPESAFKVYWDLVGMAMILYQGIMIPYRLSFGDTASGGFEVIENMMDGYFVLDVAVNFNTGFYKQGSLTMKRKRIAQHYLKTWFFIDFIASFPYTWIIDNLDALQSLQTQEGNSNLGSPTLLKLIRLIRFVRILKLLRLLKIKQLLYKFEDIFLNDSVGMFIDFAKLFASIYFIIHWQGCFFYAIGSYEQSLGGYNWLLTAGLTPSDSNAVQYITCIYWAFSTMATIGYGDIYPVTALEKGYVIFCMISACAIFAYIVGYIGSTIEKSETIIAELKIKVLQIKQFMAHHNLPASYKQQVKRYLDYVVEYKRSYKLEEEEVLDMLSEGLRLELTVHLNGKMLHSTPIFRFFDIQFLSEVTFILRKETLTDDYKLFDEGDAGSTLYFITRGCILLIHRQTHTYIKELGMDDFFGEVAFFSALSRKVTARCKDVTEVLILDQKDFLSQANTYPSVLQAYHEMQSQINEESNLQCLGTVCYLCERDGHVAVDCEMFGLIRGNLKKHAYEKLKQIQKLVTQQSRTKKLRRATSRLNFDLNDSICTDEEEEGGDGSSSRHRDRREPAERYRGGSTESNIHQIREATNEDESEQLEDDDEEEDLQKNKLILNQGSQSDASAESDITDDKESFEKAKDSMSDDEISHQKRDLKRLDHDLKKLQIRSHMTKQFDRRESSLLRSESIKNAKSKLRQNHEQSRLRFLKRDSVLKSLTFKAQNNFSPTLPLKRHLDIHDIEEEKSESGSSISNRPAKEKKQLSSAAFGGGQQVGGVLAKDLTKRLLEHQEGNTSSSNSLKHAVTVRELNQIITKVKINSKMNESVRQNSFIAQGVKYALKEIYKEIRSKSQDLEHTLKFRQEKTNLDRLNSSIGGDRMGSSRDPSSTLQQPSQNEKFKQAIAKKIQFIRGKHHALSQDFSPSNTGRDSESLSKGSISRMATQIEEGKLVERAAASSHETPKARRISVFAASPQRGLQSLFNHAFSAKLKEDFRRKSSNNSNSFNAQEQFLSHQNTGSNFSKLAFPLKNYNPPGVGAFKELDNSSQHSVMEPARLNKLASNVKIRNSQTKQSSPNFREKDSLSKLYFQQQQTNKLSPIVTGLTKKNQELKLPPQTSKTKVQSQSIQKNQRNRNNRRKSILVNGQVEIPDDLNLKLLEEIIANMSIDSLTSSVTSSEQESEESQFELDEEQEDEFKDIQSAVFHQYHLKNLQQKKR